MAVGQLITNTAYRTVSGTAPRSEVEVGRGWGVFRVESICGVAVRGRVWVTWLVFWVVSIGGVAVGWRVWVTWLVVVVWLRCRFRI